MYIILLCKLSQSLTQKKDLCDLFWYIFMLNLVSSKRKTIFQDGWIHSFSYILPSRPLWCLISEQNLVNGLFGVKIIVINFLKIGLANDFDSFCMHLWVNPTKWTHKRFPWSIRINLCHVLERCVLWPYFESLYDMLYITMYFVLNILSY